MNSDKGIKESGVGCLWELEKLESIVLPAFNEKLLKLHSQNPKESENTTKVEELDQVISTD